MKSETEQLKEQVAATQDEVFHEAEELDATTPIGQLSEAINTPDVACAHGIAFTHECPICDKPY